MGPQHNCSGRRFIYAAAFHPHQSVFDHIHPPDTVSPGYFVQAGEQFHRCQHFAVQADRVSFFEADIDISGFVRCIFWTDGQSVHPLFRFIPGIFQESAFMGQVKNIPIPAVNILFRLGQRDVVFDGVLYSILTTANIPLAPWRNDFKLRVERHHREFKTNLVITLAGAAVRNRIRTFGLGNFNQRFPHQRSSDGGPQ